MFVNSTGIYKCKAKDSEIAAISLCLGHVSKDWSVDNMKKTELNGYVYDFSVDYNGTWLYIRHSQVFNEEKGFSVKCLGF